MTSKPDWERIEQSYRTGLMSIREMATLAGISEGAIRKRAKAHGWERDISAKVNSKADALVRTEQVRSQVRTERALSERVLIEATAQVIADVRLQHRGDIAKARRLSMTLLAELESQTGSLELLEQLGELLRSEDDRGQDRLNDLYHKIIATPSRIDGVKKLSDALKNLIGLEREAYGLNAVAEQKAVHKEMDEIEADRRITELERKWSATLVG